MTINDISNDVKTIGEEILGRALSDDEIQENAEALIDYFEILVTEDCDGDKNTATDLFNADFRDKLKEQLEQD